MRVRAEISMYPLRVTDLSRPVDEFCRTLQAEGLEVQISSMSSSVTGECEHVFKALQEAFERSAEEYQVVMVSKISNACPEMSQDSGVQ